MTRRLPADGAATLAMSALADQPTSGLKTVILNPSAAFHPNLRVSTPPRETSLCPS